MNRILRVLRIFLVWLVIISLMGMAFSHLGFDSPEVKILAPILAVGVTAYWLHKFPK